MSDGDGWRQYSRRGALGLMGVGGGLVVTETLGFTDVTRGRGVNVGVSEDTDALLGIEVVESGDNDGPLDDDTNYGTPLTLEFEDRSNEEITITSIDLPDGLDSEDSDGNIDLSDTETTDIELDDEAEVTGDITIEADIGDSESIRVVREDITVVVDQVDVSADNSDLDTDEEVEVTLELQSRNDNTVEADGVDVDFDLDGDDGSLSDEDEITDEDGKATVTYSSDDETTATVEGTATVIADEVTPSDTTDDIDVSDSD